MPVLKHAKKKLRQDKKRTETNKKFKDFFKNLLKKARLNPTEKAVREAVAGLDKAAKKNIIHKNKASRLKSALMKKANAQSQTKKEKPIVKAGKKASRPAKKETKSKATSKTPQKTPRKPAK